jgi:hypothetical protein
MEKCGEKRHIFTWEGCVLFHVHAISMEIMLLKGQLLFIKKALFRGKICPKFLKDYFCFRTFP